MISRQDILDRAAEWQLRPEVVEKDYVLGWLLSSIGLQADMQTTWVFKGGTCIKKTYFETYRFSEDLDFTLLPDADYTEESIREHLESTARHCVETSGIEIPLDQIRVIPRQNKAGQPTFQARVYYRGPLQRMQNYASIIFDITKQETVVADPVGRPVFHPYPDELPADLTVRSYSLDELLAEKTRALFERTRPRDLYDVVYLLENCVEALNLDEVRRIFFEKCTFKDLAVPSSAELRRMVAENEELRSEWANMLGHQLPNLPVIDDVVARFNALIGWVDEPEFVFAEAALPVAASSSQETSIGLAGIRYWGSGSSIETIRFAGANRLLLEFNYHGKHRTAEPYSIRQARTTGNILLYAWELASDQIKAFKMDEIMNAQATSTAFTPRYQVELSAQGPMNIPPVSSAPRSFTPRVSRIPRISTRGTFGPTYIFECPICNKRFRRKSYDSKLNPHKTKDGWDCPGRSGYLTDTVY